MSIVWVVARLGLCPRCPQHASFVSPGPRGTPSTCLVHFLRQGPRRIVRRAVGARGQRERLHLEQVGEEAAQSCADRSHCLLHAPTGPAPGPHAHPVPRAHRRHVARARLRDGRRRRPLRARSRVRRRPWRELDRCGEARLGDMHGPDLSSMLALRARLSPNRSTTQRSVCISRGSTTNRPQIDPRLTPVLQPIEPRLTPGLTPRSTRIDCGLTPDLHQLDAE